MAKVTWLGEGEEGPNETTWKNRVFKKGEAVEVNDPAVCEKASGNRYFKVEDYEKPPEPKVPTSVPAPSTMATQYPVPKPGEPVVPKSVTKKV